MMLLLQRALQKPSGEATANIENRFIEMLSMIKAASIGVESLFEPLMNALIY